LQSIASRQGIAYRHNNAGLISKVSDEVASEIAENLRHRHRQPHWML